MALLAAWILYLDFSSRIHRAFALFVGARAATLFFTQLFLADPSQATLWMGVRGYFIVAQVPALINFFVVYNWRRPSTAVKRTRWLLLAAFFLFEVLYLSNHDLLIYLDPVRGQTPGALGFLSSATFTVAGLFAIWLALGAERTLVPVQARFHALLALAFSSMALADGILPWSLLPTSGLGYLFPTGPNTLAPNVSRAVFLLAVPLALTAVALLVRGSLRERHARARLYWILGITAFSTIVPFVGGLLNPDQQSPPDAGRTAFRFLQACTRLVFPLLVGYAVARQTLSHANLFQLDYRVKLSLSNGTFGAVIVATFFVVSEGASKLFQFVAALEDVPPAWAEVLGIMGAGILLIALHPLQRFGDRVARSVVPHAKPASEMTAADRLRLFGEQVQIAWADGTLSRKERLLLDRLRERLDIPIEEAARLENRAASVS